MYRRWIILVSESLLLNFQKFHRQLLNTAKNYINLQWNHIRKSVINTQKSFLNHFNTFYYYLCSCSYLHLLYLNGGDTICYCTPLPNSAFSNSMLVFWNLPWWEYLYLRNWKTSQIRVWSIVLLIVYSRFKNVLEKMSTVRLKLKGMPCL